MRTDTKHWAFHHTAKVTRPRVWSQPWAHFTGEKTGPRVGEALAQGCAAIEWQIQDSSPPRVLCADTHTQVGLQDVYARPTRPPGRGAGLCTPSRGGPWLMDSPGVG